MDIKDNVARAEVANEIASRTRIRFWLRIIIGITIGIVCHLYYGWKGLLLAAFIYGVIDGIGIFAQQVKIAKLKIKYTEITEGFISAEERGNIMGQGLGKGSVLGLYSIFLVFLTVGGIAAVAKLITSIFH